MTSLICALLVGLGAQASIQVDGDGFLRFAKGSEVVYARHATLVWRDGLVVAESGEALWPKVSLKQAPDSLEVSLQGDITAVSGGTSVVVGRVVLAVFEDDVRPVESGRFLKVYGSPKLLEPGEGLAGVIRPWGGEAKPEQSYVRVHQPDKTTTEEPLKTETDTVVAVKRTRLTSHQPDEDWLKSGGVEIAFPDVSEVSRLTMTLGDVADIFAGEELKSRLALVDLGTSPVFGVPRQIDRTLILSRIKAAGFNPAKVRVVGPVRLQIKRVGQRVSQAEFIETAVKRIAQDYPGLVAESEKPVPDLDVPAGELSLTVERVAEQAKTVAVTVAAYVDGHRINSRTVTFVNRAVPTHLKVGDTVTIIVKSRAVQVESEAKVKKIDPVSGVVTVELPSKKQLSGRLGTSGKVEVEV